MEQSEERTRSFFLPKNFQNGISIGTHSYPASFLVQGVVFALLPVAAAYWILPAFGMVLSVSDSIGTVLMFSTLFGYAGIHGVKGGTFLQFLKAVFRFYRSRRTAYYNPRVRIEVAEEKKAAGKEQELPREKLKKFLSGFHRTSVHRAASDPADTLSEAAEPGELFFEEDIGIVKTPVEYMNPKEYRIYRKNLKKEERRKTKEERRRRKEAQRGRKKERKAKVSETSAEHSAESSDQRTLPRHRHHKG